MHGVVQVQTLTGRTFCSGAIVRRTKLVVSAAHCFADDEPFQLHGYHGTYFADLVYLDATQDVAVLRPYGVGIGRRDGFRLARIAPDFGDAVLSIGHAQGDKLPFTMSKGTVAHPHRVTWGEHWMQSSALLERGMSGGPTLNEAGELVGVNLFVWMLPLSNWSGHAHFSQIEKALTKAQS